MSSLKEQIEKIRKTLTTPGSWGRPRFLLDHEVDPTLLSLYRANPSGFGLIDASAKTQFEALHFSPEDALALSSAMSVAGAQGRASEGRAWISPSDLADMTPEDRAALDELIGLIVDQNPYLRESRVRALSVWSEPAGSSGAAPDGAWDHALEAVGRGIPVDTIERAVATSVKVRQADPTVSPTEVGVLFQGSVPPEEIGASVFGVGTESGSVGKIVAPALFGAGAGLLAASAFGGPVGWAVGGAVALAWWLLS